MVVSGCRSSAAEYWQLKPWTSYSQRSSDSNRPDYLSLEDLYWSSNLGEPHSLGSLCLNVVLCHFIEEASNVAHLVAHFTHSFHRG